MPRPQRFASVLSGPHPVVVDAGALDLAVGAPAPRIVTPHAREHARLRTGARPRDADPASEDGRVAAARETAAALGATVVLKGAVTMVARPDGWTVLVEAGTPWLATAGTGDVLGGRDRCAGRGGGGRSPARRGRPRPRGARGDRRVAPRPRRDPRRSADRSARRADHRARRRRSAAARGRRGSPGSPDAGAAGVCGRAPRIQGCRGERCCGWRSPSCMSSVAVLGFVMPNQPMGDVYLVYEPWSRDALAGTGSSGSTASLGVPAARAGADAPRAGPRVDRRVRGRPGRS